MRTVIKGGTVVTADQSYQADVAIENGLIVEIGPDLVGEKTLDAEGCYVMPGGIDPHVHLQMPFMGTFSADDFESGTRAALAGGTTMVVDFCLPDQGQSPLDALKVWDDKAKGACADYSYHMAVTWWGEKMFDGMADAVDRGINSFKHFLAYKGALMVNDEELFASFRRCADLGATAMVHAENGDVVAAMQQKLLEDGVTGPEGHAMSRPPEVEGEATNRAIMLADMAGVPLYVVHTSCEQAHEAIRRARAKGMRVYGEPLIQHLVLDNSVYRNESWDHAAQCVMSPPFRDKLHQDSLWAGLQSGSLQVVATDHAAFTLEQKRFGIGDFTKIPNGTGGLEERMPVLWTEGVNTGRLTPNEFVAVTSTNIAKILNAYPQKGAVLVGSDADLVVWDPKKTATITTARQQSVIEYNVFEGRQVTGLPRYTLSRGEVAVEDGQIRAIAGHGRFVRRAPSAPVNRALSTWKALNAPQPVLRSSANMPGGI